MTNSITFVATQMPQLRRFARVLTGSQTVADSYALATLEAADAAPPFSNEVEARLWLYRALLTTWMRIEVREAEPGLVPGAKKAPVEFTLMAVAPLPRAAFLLQSMEEFQKEQVADIMQRPLRDVEYLIDQAGEELARQISTNVLLVEEEQFTSVGLQTSMG
jgi:DNA-directed RNA polymerase specialized sigma24 family protein